MITAYFFDALYKLQQIGEQPFSSFARGDVQRSCYRGVYNDIAAQVDGFTESCKILVEKRPSGRVNVCFAPDLESPTRGKSCPPGHVIEGLATGVYNEILKPQGIKPENVYFCDHNPAFKMTGATWMDDVAFPNLWREGKMRFVEDEYHLERQTTPTEAFDKSWRKDVPKIIKQLPRLTASQEYDLRRYTQRPSSISPRAI